MSLVSHGFSVSLVVADGKANEVRSSVSIWDVGVSRRRVGRVLHAPSRVFRKALELNADLYHLHDPELIPAGLKLKRLGKRVIFDSHEDVPRQMLGKPYLNRPARWTISRALAGYEAWACRRLDGVVAATPLIRDKFRKVNSNVVDIKNFPHLSELVSGVSFAERAQEVCYVGGLARIRGIAEIVAAVDLVESGVRLNLCGTFGQPDFEQVVKQHPGWRKVRELGFVDRQGVREVLGRSIAGLVTLHPVINYIDALPVKMFEYMSAGIPVIASDFPLWRQIVEGSDCGVLVDPLEPGEIAKAIDYLIKHPGEAERMGANGRKAVVERYNWQTEEEKLLQFYREVLKRGRH